MRKIFTLLLLLAGLAGNAQQYNNEWIKFNQTYYKIKVGSDGVYRIPKSLLDGLGIGNASVQNFELWRNGERVPFYPSVPSGALPANGYLEFWGEKNDGKPDKPLYRNPAYQHSEKLSLQTDTAIYFLSVNNDQTGFLVTDVVNNVSGNALPAEDYIMWTAGLYPVRTSGYPNNGLAANVGAAVLSASYDRGEFFSSDDIRANNSYSKDIAALNVYSGGPNSTLKFGAAGNAMNARNVRARVNGTIMKDTVMDYYSDLLTTVPVPTSLIASSFHIDIDNLSAIADDRLVVSFVEITYPRIPDLNGVKNFAFELPAKSAGYFLKFTNFNNAGVPPVLYDLTNGERYVGDLSSPGSIQFALGGTANVRKLILVSEDASNIRTVTAATPRVFIRYTDAGNQGNYLLISNSVLFTGTSGNNPVIDYKNYRESAAGGSYKVVLADIDELVDQFAFGIKKHPLSIRNFIRFARTHFSMPLKFVFLVGRGMNYADYQKAIRAPNQFPLTEQLNLVPTFGNPASDNLLSADDLTVPVATTPIGRLSVVRGKEIEDYLEKVKEYEQTQKNSPNTLAGREWMKNVVHVTGSSDPYLGTILCNYMGVYRQMIEDTLFGAKVTTFCKQSTNPVEQLSSERLSQLFAEGISFLTYFGHSSASTLEFNIESPDVYNNQGKYPVFFVNGCNAGNFFTYNTTRLVANETLSEKFVLAKQRGTIAFVASTHFGIVNYLNLFLTNLYNVIGKMDFYKSLGETQRDAMQQMINSAPIDFYARMHAEEITLHGDPAIYINASPKPDYVVESSSIKLNPAFISLAENNFNVRLKIVNLGRANKDSIRIEVKQQYPDGSTGILFNQKIKPVRYADSIQLQVPIVASRDKGLNKLIVMVDADNAVDEVTETNNSITLDFSIFEEEARPVYPYNFAIINNASQKLYASTANPLSRVKNYVMEIDTTEAFSSPVKIAKTVTSAGGLLEFEPGITYRDSTTYYWRVGEIPTDNTPFHWVTASFTYINANQEGFGQFHYFQNLKSATKDIELTNNLKWTFGTGMHEVFFSNAVYPFGSDQEATYYISLDNSLSLGSGCNYNEVIINVINPVTFKPWQNSYSGNVGQYGSHGCGGTTRGYNFTFYHNNAVNRKLAMDFLDMIPNGYYVLIRNNASPGPEKGNYPQNVYPEAWKADTTLYGPGNSLYHRLFYAGLYEIDSFSIPRAMNFIYKKGDTTFNPRYNFSKDMNFKATLALTCATPDTVGFITSPVFGPAKRWQRVIWTGQSSETPSSDNPTVEVIGIDKNNSPTVLFTMDKDTRNLDISSVDTSQYPYMQLRMRNIDSVALTPFQLKYWSIHHIPVPEGAIAPNILLKMKDTLEVGDSLRFEVAFKNISIPAFDSIAVKVTILDKNNVTHTIQMPKRRPIVTGDTVVLAFTVGTIEYTGINTLYVDFNYNNDQLEYLHFNNFLYHQFYVIPDKTNPLLDVTFDGVHILNRDIVSAKPHIQIKLKDEAKFMLLNDTTISSIDVRYPNNTVRTFHFDSDTLRFIPATTGSDNTATIDFMPIFTQLSNNPEGDEYELIVKGKDKSGNKAGDVEYRVAFRIIDKPMISNLLNYPNPFSTSTAFVFTITGSELPQNIRIQILTVTGKIVREITMNELGTLHIGRNITEFKWDGTDQYGDKLANGVYLYRVITSMNGSPMEKYKAKGDNTDKYFNNGYGKMYLMR